MNVDIAGVSKIFHTGDGERVTALKDVSVKIQPGQFVSLLGPSGCGKTTLLNIVAGLTNQTDGNVYFSEQTQPGFMFQSPTLLPWRTAVDNVLLPAELGGRPKLAQRRADATLEQRAQELLRTVGLSGFEHRYPEELSGGMQQRVAIARALLLESSLVLMDEPFSALDEFTREAMNLLILDVWAARGFTAMFVTHNVFEAVFLADRVLVMTPRPGRIVEDVTVSLPRPRTSDMIGSDGFAADVRRVRQAIQSFWLGDSE